MPGHRKAVGSLLLALLLQPLPCKADSYDKICRVLVAAAARAGLRRIAVLPLKPALGSDGENGLVLSERILGRLADGTGLQIVERTLLDGVMDEYKLGYEGWLDPRQAGRSGKLMGVEGVVSGTFLTVKGGKIEINARLIDANTARVLGTVSARVEAEWQEEWPTSSSNWEARPPAPALRWAPVVRLEPDPFRDAPADDCAGWEERMDTLQSSVLELKARHWAAKLRQPGFSPRGLKRNPGSEIRSVSLRQNFYARTKELYEQGYQKATTPQEELFLQNADIKAETLQERCY